MAGTMLTPEVMALVGTVSPPEANDYVLRDLLGMSKEEVKGLEEVGVVGRRPQSLEEQKALGWIQGYNKAYSQDVETGFGP